MAALAISTRSLAQTPTFNALVQTPVTVGSGFPDDATVGDINGDGKLDAIIPGINGIRVLLGNGNGTFVDQVTAIADVTTSNVVNLHPSLVSYLPRPVGGIGGLGGGIKAVDVNRDGKLDLVCVTSVGINFVNYSFVSVLINSGVNGGNGVPLFTTTHHWMPFLGVRPVTVGDLNGDNWPDFIVGTCCNGIQVWTSNGGSGTFTPGQVFSLTPGAGGPSVGQGVITDLNGDGKADYVVSSGQNGGANVFFGNGNGTLQTPGNYLPNGAASVAVADVNGDGRPDLLMGNATAGSEGLYVYLNSGGGVFSAPSLYAIPGFASNFSGGCSVVVADINGDGKLDAVLSNTNSNSIAILLGDGNGGFGAPGTYPASVFPTFLFVGDFNGDGKPDIGVDLRNSRAFGVLLNTTVPPPPSIDFAVPQRTQWGIGASFGHIFSNTGLPDVLSSFDGQSTFVRTRKNNGNGNFTEIGGFFLPGGLGGNNTEKSVLADMNNDGFDDIVAIARSGLGIFLNDGQGGFAQSALYPETGSANAYFPANFQSIRLAVGRASPTGNVDVIVTGAGTGGLSTVLVFHGNGDGTVASNPVSLNIAHNYLAPSIKFEDVSNDGYPAIVATGAWGNPVKVFRNNRDGSYTASFTLNAANQNEFLSSAQFIDMDRDGTADLVVAHGAPAGNSWVGGITWYEGLGNLTYSTSANNAFTGAAERWSGSAWLADWFYDTITAADIDGDGQIDLIGSTQNARVAVLRNKGDGTFSKAWESSKVDTLGNVAFATSTYFVDITGTGPSLIGVNGVFNAFQTFSSFGEYWGRNLNAQPADTTPPVITAPANITVEATGPNGAVVNFTATAQDNVDGPVNVTANRPSGSTFPLGTTTVSLTATDAAGNSATASFTITVRDTTPPAISAPATATAEATSPAGAVVTFVATANDLVSGNVPVTATPSSGSTFPLGFSSVSLSAQDAAGKTASGTIIINVRDTIAPTLTVPANQVIEATSAAGAVATFAATATDAAGVPSLAYSAAPGSTFPLGIATVTVTAKDAANNTSSGSFTITVRDTTAPAISVPANITADATSPSGAVVSYTAPTATDAVGVTSLTYGPPSGSVFPIGTSTVTVTAVDAAGNTATGSFTITVLSSAQQLANLTSAVNALVAQASVKNQLTATLGAATNSIANGNVNSASGQLGAFVNQVEAALRSGKLTDAQAQPLITAANNIVDSLR